MDNSQFPHLNGTIKDFLSDILDPSKIQCILDLPMAHMGLREDCR